MMASADEQIRYETHSDLFTCKVSDISPPDETCADALAHDHAAAFKDSPEEKAIFEIGLEVSRALR